MRARSYSNRALAVASGMLWAGIPQPTSAARAADDQFQNLCFDRGYGLIRSGFVPWGKRVSHKDHHKSNLRFGGVLAISDDFLGPGHLVPFFR